MAEPQTPDDKAFDDALFDQTLAEQQAAEQAPPPTNTMTPAEMYGSAATGGMTPEQMYGGRDPGPGYISGAAEGPIAPQPDYISNPTPFGPDGVGPGQAGVAGTIGNALGRAGQGLYHGVTKIPVAADAAGGGAAEAGFQFHDFLFGPTAEDQKSDFRKSSEAETQAASADLGEGGPFIAGLGQFTAGMVGTGKFTEGLKLLPWVGKGVQAVEDLARGSKLVRTGLEAGKATVVNTTMFDPHQERLSNLIQQSPVLANPINGYLAADPKDSDAEGRLKNALENLGIEAGTGVLLMGGMRLYKALASGDKVAIRQASEDVLKAQDE